MFSLRISTENHNKLRFFSRKMIKNDEMQFFFFQISFNIVTKNKILLLTYSVMLGSMHKELREIL